MQTRLAAPRPAPETEGPLAAMQTRLGPLAMPEPQLAFPHRQPASGESQNLPVLQLASLSAL